MKKRLLSFLVALCAAAALLPNLALPAAAVTNGNVISVTLGNGQPTEYSTFAEGWSAAVGSGNTNGATVKLLADWKAPSNGTFGTTTGEYFNGAILVPGGKTVTLDLNGYTIDRCLTQTVSEESNVISVCANDNTPAVLTVEDNSSNDVTKQGKITGGYTKGDGGGIVIGANGTLNLTGGNITGNYASAHGGGVYVYGAFHMTGGKISGNVAGHEVMYYNPAGGAGGVCVNYKREFTMTGGEISGNYEIGKNDGNGNGGRSGGLAFYSTSVITLGGTAIIENNLTNCTYSDNIINTASAFQSNVTLLKSGSNLITCGTGENALKTGAYIGVTTYIKPTETSPVAVTSNSGESYSYFHSDDALYGTGAADGVVKLHLKVLSSISVKTQPTKTSYTIGNTFDPAGLVITLHYSSGDGDEDVPYAGHESDFSFSPVLTTALAATDTSVTVTYRGKTANQPITVEKAPVALTSAKYYQPQLWDCQRSPAFPHAGRTMSIYGLKAPYNDRLQTVKLGTGQYVRFTVLTTTFSESCSELKPYIKRYLDPSVTDTQLGSAALVSEVVYNANGQPAENGVLSSYGLVFNLSDKGFLYVSLSDALRYSGGVGTFVSRTALKDTSSVILPDSNGEPCTKQNLDGSFFIEDGDNRTPTKDVFDLSVKLVDASGSVTDTQKNVNVSITYNGITRNGTTNENGNVVFSNMQKEAAATTFNAVAGGKTTYTNVAIPDSNTVSLIYIGATGEGPGAVSHTATLTLSGNGANSAKIWINGSRVQTAATTTVLVPAGGSVFFEWAAGTGYAVNTVTGTGNDTQAKANGYAELTDIQENKTVNVSIGSINTLSHVNNYIEFTSDYIFDVQRAAAFPQQDRILTYSELRTPLDSSLAPITIGNGQYIKFTGTSSVAEEGLTDTYYNSIKYYSKATKEEVGAAAYVHEALYNSSDNTKAKDLGSGMIWAYENKSFGFLFTALDGTYGDSGGIGTFVSCAPLGTSSSVGLKTSVIKPMPYTDWNNYYLVITPEDTTKDVHQLDWTETFSGLVLDQNDQAIANATASVTIRGNTYSATTDSKGAFVLNGVPYVAYGEKATAKIETGGSTFEFFDVALGKGDAHFGNTTSTRALAWDATHIFICDLSTGQGSKKNGTYLQVVMAGNGNGTVSSTNSDGKITGISYGSSVKLYFTPNTSSELTGVSIDGGNNIAEAVAAGYYTIDNIKPSQTAGQPAHTITVTFSLNPEPTPTTTFSFDGANPGMLASTTAQMQYSLDGGTQWIPCTESRTDLTAVVDTITDANDIRVRTLGQAGSTSDSDVQIIDITLGAQPQLNPTQPEVLNGTGSIPTTTTHQFSTDNITFSNCDGAKENLAPGTYYVRTKATGETQHSASQSITITAYALKPENTPGAGIDYVDEKLTGLTPGVGYKITPQGGTLETLAAYADGKIAIDAAWLGKTLSIVKPGNGTTTTDSASQSRPIPARPELTGVTKTDCTIIANNDGALTGVTAAMRYRSKTEGGSFGDWADCTGTITGIAAGTTYELQIKAVANTSFASAVSSYTIAAYQSTPETAPDAAIDYVNEKLTGFAANTTYTINGSSKTSDTAGKLPIESGWFHATLSIVKPGDGIHTTDSDPKSLIVPVRPAAPTVGKTDCATSAQHDGTLTGTTTAMEYKESAGNWANCADGSVTGLAPGSYSVRYQATNTSFASDCTAPLVIAQYVPTPYDITYEMNGGTNAGQNPIAYNVESAPITLANPTRTGFLFLGWTFSGQTTPTETVTIPTGSTGDKQYTACWKAATPVSAPNGYSISEKTNTTLNITGTVGYEYSLDHGATWQAPASGFIRYTGLTAETNYTVQCRVAQITTPHLLAEESDAYTIETIKTGAAPTDGKSAIEGKIHDKDGNPLANVTVKLLKYGTDGTAYATTTTDAAGCYAFSAVPYGSYSLVATKGSQTVTRQVGIQTPFVIQDLVLLNGQESTKVEVGQNTPSVAAGGLDNMFTQADADLLSGQAGAKVEIKLSVTQKEATGLPAGDADKIGAVLPGNTKIGLYLDAKLLRTVTGSSGGDVTDQAIQPPTGKNVQIVIDLPQALWGKAGYSVATVHNGQATIVTGVSCNTTLHTLTIPAQGFSTFAILYQENAAPEPVHEESNGAQATTAVTTAPAIKTTPATGDGSHPAAWAAVLVISLGGMTVLFRNKQKQNGK